MNQEEIDRKLAGRDRVREVARDFIERGEGVAWFEAFYRDAQGDPDRVPWADREGNPLFAQWLAANDVHGLRALVVGCGLGEDAELCARAGASVTAFDVSPTAIELCPQLWPGTAVDYRAEDLFATPQGWRRDFELVVEIYTVQALPLSYRERAVERVADLVAPGGQLVVVTHARASAAPAPPEIPWPLSPEELALFEAHGLNRKHVSEHVEEHPLRLDEGPVTRWCAHFERPKP